jgi:hypothetical protein
MRQLINSLSILRGREIRLNGEADFDIDEDSSSKIQLGHI